jgi:hypothetical protein
MYLYPRYDPSIEQRQISADSVSLISADLRYEVSANQRSIPEDPKSGNPTNHSHHSTILSNFVE